MLSRDLGAIKTLVMTLKLESGLSYRNFQRRCHRGEENGNFKWNAKWSIALETPLFSSSVLCEGRCVGQCVPIPPNSAEVNPTALSTEELINFGKCHFAQQFLRDVGSTKHLTYHEWCYVWLSRLDWVKVALLTTFRSTNNTRYLYHWFIPNRYRFCFCGSKWCWFPIDERPSFFDID